MMNISFPKECENLTKSQKKFFKSLGVALTYRVGHAPSGYGMCGAVGFEKFLTSKKFSKEF